jgi:hypothetical protein
MGTGKDGYPKVWISHGPRFGLHSWLDKAREAVTLLGSQAVLPFLFITPLPGGLKTPCAQPPGSQILIRESPGISNKQVPNLQEGHLLRVSWEWGQLI